MLEELRNALHEAGDPEKARFLQGYFKTGPGQYGEGDIFLGIKVPQQRKLAQKYRELPLSDIDILLLSPIHEERLTALFILAKQYEKATPQQREAIHRLYLKRKRRINNWDLVDSSAPMLLGEHLRETDRSLLYKMAGSKNIWERRMAAMATFPYIRAGEFDDAFAIIKSLLPDGEDLIQKAAGWMLREIGNRDRKAEEEFLKAHAAKMGRTMLRYAIEKFPEEVRKGYLSGKYPKRSR